MGMEDREPKLVLPADGDDSARQVEAMENEGSMKGTWEAHYFCESCAQRLSIRQVLYTYGTCPKCGYRGVEAVTVVAHQKRTARRIFGRWWRFWVGHWEYMPKVEKQVTR